MRTSMVWLAAVMVALLVGRMTRADEPKTASGNVETIRGRVTAMDAQQHTLTVQPRKGEAVKLTYDDKSRFETRAGAGKVELLKVGQRVRVTYDMRDGAAHVLTLRDPLVTLDEVKGAVNQALDTAKTYAFQMRDEYKQRLNTTTRDLDERIAELEERASEGSAEAQARAKTELEELRQKRRVLYDRLQRIGNATADSWSDVQAGVNAAINDLQTAIERARRRADAP